MELAAFESWLERYFAAWESNDPDAVAALFGPEATYAYGPFGEPTRGRDAIVEEWVAGGVGEDFVWRSEALAVAGRQGIAHFAVSFVDPLSRRSTEMDGIFLADFDVEGRCVEFREWYEKRESA